MKASLRLIKIFGISIEIHLTFLILPFLFLLLWGLRGFLLILFVFLCVTLHELTHSLMARRFGAEVDRIVLFPIGGIAMMRSIPEKPYQELLISVVGPLFNLLFAAILYFPLRVVVGADVLHQFPPTLATWQSTLAYMFWINPLLAIFNLLPAFPLDGGRVFRAILAQRMDYQKATKIAVSVGHAMAIALGLMGLFVFPRNYLLVIIAIFIYMAASQEDVEVDVRTTLERFFVKDILPNEFQSVDAGATLKDVLETIFHSHQEDFPVVESKKLVGLLTRSDIMRAVHQHGMDKTVRDVMHKTFPSVSPRDSLRAVHRLMAERNVKAVLVIDKGNLQGMVTLEDLTKIYVFMAKRD